MISRRSIQHREKITIGFFLCSVLILLSLRYIVLDSNDEAKPMILTSSNDTIHYIEWNTDGNLLGSLHQPRNDHQCNVKVWNFSQQKLETKIESENFTWNSQIVWSPNRIHVAISGYNFSINQGVVQLFNTTTWKPIISLIGNFSSFQSIDWSWNGQYLAAVSEIGNHQSSKLTIWNSTTWNEVSVILENHVTNIEWHPFDEILSTAHSDNSVRIYDSSGHQIRILSDHSGDVNRVRWSPLANLLAASSTDGIFFYNTSTWTIHGYIDNYYHSDFRNDIAWNEDGSKIASTSNDYTLAITIFSIEDYKWESELFGHKEKTKLSWHSSTHLLASSSADGSIEIWNY